MGNTSTAEYIAGEMIATIIHDSDLLDMNKEKVAHVRAKLAEKLAEPLCKEGAALFTKEFIEDFCIGEDTDVQSILAAHPSLQPAHDMLNEFFEEGEVANDHDTAKGEGAAAEGKQKPDEQKRLVVDILGPDGQVRCTKCLLRATTYSLYGNIAIQAYATAESRTASGEKLEPGEDWGMLTVNPTEELPDYTVCVKNYSEGEGNLRTLLDAGIVEPPYRYIPSGLVALPVCRLTPKGRDWLRPELAVRDIVMRQIAGGDEDGGEGGEAEKPAATQRKADGTMTGEYECQLNTALACVEAFKGVLDAVSEVDDVVGQPGEPCPVASQAAVKRIRRIVQVHIAPLCGKEET